MDKLTKRQNFDPEYYRARYFLNNFRTDEEALEHWDKVGYRKSYLISVCDELKTHDHCLCSCKVKNDFRLKEHRKRRKIRKRDLELAVDTESNDENIIIKLQEYINDISVMIEERKKCRGDFSQ
ncbi:MAG: hypothetical protein Hyperionvirus17_23 [Hyperionvirus sp.]|uniref:Uncharacterized protein n=1 Tax=Hyperionvirus sp. TaxID=2487770 RepID=A0A3G5AE03_9VIRU|nr:MAG: hypothetical protein Hyperionvirus17_23 [Hyperionvirus sp.]